MIVGLFFEGAQRIGFRDGERGEFIYMDRARWEKLGEPREVLIVVKLPGEDA